MRITTGRFSPLLLAPLALLLAGLGCVGPTVVPPYDYFLRPSASDPWSTKIGAWQVREQALPSTEELRRVVSGPGAAVAAAARTPEPDLRAKYFSYRSERRRSMARELASWVQKQAKRHYVPDGPIDHWATVAETLDRDGDDCDGLELLVYHFLLDLGFAEDEVFRAIVHRPADGQHHMVTLWFEDPDDPWVIDPTGAMTSGMPRMSEVPSWVPLKVFSETQEFTALPRRAESASLD